MLQKGLDCWEVKSFAPLFNDVAVWTKWVLAARDKLRLEHSVGLSIDAREYFDAVSELVREGEELISACRVLEDKQGLQHVLQIHEQLKDIITREDILAKVKAARAPPFCISVIGPPKVGKSAFVDELCAVGCKAMEKTYTIDLRYNRNPLDAFDSGLKSSHRVFVFDDLGALNSKAGASSGVAVYDLLMGLFNDQASPSVQAELREKGKIFPLAWLVIVTGNSPDLDAKSYLNTPDALFRRIRYKVALTVRPQFRISPDTNVLDETKVAAAQAIVPGYRDLHLYSVVEFVISSDAGDIHVAGGQMNDPSLNIKTVQREIMSNARQEVFFEWYTKAIKHHRSVTSNMLGHAQKLIDEVPCVHGDKPGRCRLCHLALVGDSVPDFLKQGGVVSSITGCPERVRAKYREITDSALNYFSSAAFSVILSAREHTIPFVRGLLENTGEFLFSPDVKKRVLQIFSTLVVVGISSSVYLNARLVKDNDFKKIYRGLTGFEEQKMALDPDSYASLARMYSQGAPGDVYSKGEAKSAIVLTNKSKSVGVNILEQKIRANQGLLGRGGVGVGCTGLYDDVVLTVSHALSGEIGPCVLIFGSQTYQYELLPEHIIYRDEKKDVLLFHFVHRSFKDLRPFFAQKFNSYPTIDRCRFIHPVCGTSKVYTSTPYEYKQNLFYSLPENFGPGSCGGLLVAELATGAVIIAIQQYGRPVENGVGALMRPLYSASLAPPALSSRNRIFTRPTVDLSLNGLLLTPHKPISTTFHHKSYVHYREFPELFTPVCEISFGVMHPTSSLVPTKLFGQIPDCVKRPPDFFTGLRMGEWVSPMNRVVDSLCDRRAEYPECLLKEAAGEVGREMVGLIKQCPRAHPLNELQSLNGIAGVRFIDAFNSHTGQGLPKRGKKIEHMIGEPGGRMYTEQARAALDWLAEKLSKHVNPGVIADITLKDELKNVSKDIRGFAGLPMTFNDLMRRGVLPLFKIIQENALYFGIAIGVNANSYEWKHIFDKHHRRKFHVMYDFKNFDRSHHSAILAEAHAILFDMLIELYDDDAQIGGQLWHQVLATGFAIVQWMLYNVNNTIYQADGSLASGVFHTAMVNSIIQIIIVRMLWLCFVKQNPKYSGGFRKWCSLTVYGDDGMLSTDASGFNLAFMIKTAAEWNLIITDPHKRNDIPDNFPVNEWSFLKRTFVERDGKIYAPLEKMSILKALNFWELPTDTSEVQGMLERINQSFMELAIWNDAESDQIYHEVVSAFHREWPESSHQLLSLGDARVVVARHMEEPTTFTMFNLCVLKGMTPNEYERTLA